MRNIIQNINQIDQIYANPNKVVAKEMAALLDNSVQRSYFINKLITKFDLEWFLFAFEYGILSLNHIPAPTVIEDSEGNNSFGFKNWEGIYSIVEAAKVMDQYTELIPIVIFIVDEYINLAFQTKNDLKRNFTVDYHICRCIFLLPLEKLTALHLEFVTDFGLVKDRSILSREITTTFFEKVLEQDSTLAYKLLEIFFNSAPEIKGYRATSIIDDYALEVFVRDKITLLFEYLGEEVVSWAIEKLRAVSNAHPLFFSKFEVISIEPDSQNHGESGFNFTITALALQLLLQLKTKNLLKRLEQLIGSSEPILRRIAYYIVDHRYNEFDVLFWQQSNPLNDTEAKLEIYRLINRNCPHFAESQIKTLVKWIECLKVDSSYEDGSEQSIKYHAYRKLEWHTALEPIQFRYEKLLIEPFNKLQTITKGELPPHPGYDSYFTVRHGSDYSVSKRIINQSVIDVLNILANPKRWDGYNIYGLQQDLRDYVISSYMVVVEDLEKFDVIPLPFLYSFMDGFRTLADRGVSFQIEKLLTFIESFVQRRDDLWEINDSEHENANAIGMTAWVLNAIAQNNGYRLDLSNIKSAVNCLIIMDKKYHGSFEWLNGDPMTDIFNSTRGRIYDALFSYTMKVARMYPYQMPLWDADIKDYFTSKLTNQHAGSEFYWSVGFHIPQISYLDMSWLKKHLDMLLQYKEQQHNCPIFYGYLLFSTQLYTDLFDLLYQTYLAQLTILTADNNITRRFVEHIWVAYSIDRENTEQIMVKLLEQENANQFKFLIDRVNQEGKNANTSKIKYIWRMMVSTGERTNDSSLRQCLYNTVHFADLIVDFDEELLTLFKKALLFARTSLNTYRLLRTIESKISTEQYEIGGRLLEALLKFTSLEAYFDENKIIEIVKSLYSHQQIAIADAIAIASVNRNYFGLVRLYNEHHL